MNALTESPQAQRDEEGETDDVDFKKTENVLKTIDNGMDCDVLDDLEGFDGGTRDSSFSSSGGVRTNGVEDDSISIPNGIQHDLKPDDSGGHISDDDYLREVDNEEKQDVFECRDECDVLGQGMDENREESDAEVEDTFKPQTCEGKEESDALADCAGEEGRDSQVYRAFDERDECDGDGGDEWKERGAEECAADEAVYERIQEDKNERRDCVQGEVRDDSFTECDQVLLGDMKHSEEKADSLNQDYATQEVHNEPMILSEISKKTSDIELEKDSSFEVNVGNDESSSFSMDVCQQDDVYKEGGDDEKEDEDPDALTIDTGRWSGGEEECISRPAEPAVPSQPPSDDDVDPDALTIDTAPFDEELKKEVNQEYDNNEGSGNHNPGLKLTLPLTNKIRKGMNKKSRKSAVRNTSKSTKSRVQKYSGTTLKCPRCPNSSFTTVTALFDHQRICGTLSAPTAAPIDPPKVPRKVYMCSACGSYFENWDLFVHMKQMHKRNICLHCLGMFSQAAKLTQHLASKHGIVDQVLEYGDQLAIKYPGPQFLLCSRCDVMCTDQDFESHTCSAVCSHCGLAGTHYPTCRLAPPAPVKQTKTPRRRARAPRRPKKATTELPPVNPSELKATDLLMEGPNPSDDLSPTSFNEKMMQLYRGYKVQERSFSTLESIEESINRVVDNVKQEVHEADVDTNGDYENTPIEPQVENIKEDTPPPTPKQKSSSETSDSERLTIQLPKPRKKERIERPDVVEEPDQIIVAGEDTPFTSVPLPEPLDRNRVPTAMKLFLRATALTCVYCAHARKIAVNAKQLALHQLAQHRYVTIPDSSTHAEKTACHSAVVRVVKETVPSLENVFFNAYGFDSGDKSAWRSADRVYECFHCSYITPDLREFTLHNRKIHWSDLRKTRQTESHLCIMCKTRFLTYSELLCHLCRGVYIAGQIIDPHCKYRCYCCDIEPLPSSFRLMVHLRLTHTACDMCFTLCDSQAALSAHVMKHKSLYYCYACALTYETRAELSKHIFWKHGAESVTCKRCLQKKWKHAYHFCLPPPGFSCDACGSWFKTSATLRVHQRLHTGETPHACKECSEEFISKKLLEKHALTHGQVDAPAVNGTCLSPVPVTDDKKKIKKAKKDIRDLFDLPPVNLSESDDSSDNEETKTVKEPEVKEEKPEVQEKEQVQAQEPEQEQIEVQPVAGPSSEPAPVSVWDNVLASLQGAKNYPPDSPFYNLPAHRVAQIMLMDHDYCRPPVSANEDARVGLDHDYCNSGMTNKSHIKHSPKKQNKQRVRMRSSSSDSTSSSSSSHSCGSSCSCSSSTSSTESASSGEPRINRRKKMEKEKKKTKDAKVEPEVSVDVCEARIQESDLETDEEVTDDDEFYELNPALRASEVLRLNRSMLLDKLEGVPSPSQEGPPALAPSPRHKGRSKKKRSGHTQLAMSKVELSPLHASSPYTPHYTSTTSNPVLTDDSNAGDSDRRRPKRKRVPLRFYGFSSGDEDDIPATPPRKKERPVEKNTTIAASPPLEPSNLWNPPAWRPPPVPPRVNPIKIKTGSLKQTFAKSNNSDEFHIKRAELGGFHVNGAGAADDKEKLYCFCQCPYDEVSEMIACDAHDCMIEWFHFECVGIMDPPKGKWYCPDCKKKAAAQSEMMSIPLR